MPPLEAEIRRRIAAAGPMPVASYMALCLADPLHGYYRTRDPLGAAGDFTTAPEISQMFGELIGVWMVAVWQQMGSPEMFRLIELGPGRGTMMKDALRAAKIVPAFGRAAVVHLVEINPILQNWQERTLADTSNAIFWHAALADVPAGPAIVIANEFFDALPVHQAVKLDDGWHERGVTVAANNRLAFVPLPERLTHFSPILPAALAGAATGDIFEWRPASHCLALGKRNTNPPGAALVIDYGHTESATGETLQAVGQHGFVDPLAAPGTVDLTAHVDFQAMAMAVSAMGADVHGPITQAELLRRLGLSARAAALKTNAPPGKAADVDAAVTRLTGHGRTGMGGLFKAMAFGHPALGVLPGFETASAVQGH
jgi:SAM-dependent MidA family methyltransferase